MLVDGAQGATTWRQTYVWLLGSWKWVLGEAASQSCQPHLPRGPQCRGPGVSTGEDDHTV